MRISDWSSDVCSSDLPFLLIRVQRLPDRRADHVGGQKLGGKFDAGEAVIIDAADDDHRHYAALRSVAMARLRILALAILVRLRRTRRLASSSSGLSSMSSSGSGLPGSPRRSEERRVGKEWVSPGRSRWSR